MKDLLIILIIFIIPFGLLILGRGKRHCQKCSYSCYCQKVRKSK